MARDIKFRAWFRPTAEYKADYVDRYDKELPNLEVDYYTEEAFLDDTWVNIDNYEQPIIFEQYTGLKDKNGKEIYEGDIVEEDIDFNSKMTDGTFRYKVYYNEDELCWSLDPIGPESIHNDLWETNASREVIGNIHEGVKNG